MYKKLRSGEKWADRIYQEIDKRDILYLLWSNYAKQSHWVDAEWRYAYSINGEDGIEPVPLESAAVCPPPKELASKHFNDDLLYMLDNNSSSIMDMEYLKSKMSELKELLQIGLYTMDEYEVDRKALLEEYRKQQLFLK